jgi:hypothetical protein
MVVVWWLYGGCMMVVWRLYGGCMVVVWRLYGGCMVVALWLCGGAKGRAPLTKTFGRISSPSAWILPTILATRVVLSTEQNCALALQLPPPRGAGSTCNASGRCRRAEAHKTHNVEGHGSDNPIRMTNWPTHEVLQPRDEPDSVVVRGGLEVA